MKDSGGRLEIKGSCGEGKLNGYEPDGEKIFR